MKGFRTDETGRRSPSHRCERDDESSALLMLLATVYALLFVIVFLIVFLR